MALSALLVSVHSVSGWGQDRIEAAPDCRVLVVTKILVLALSIQQSLLDWPKGLTVNFSTCVYEQRVKYPDNLDASKSLIFKEKGVVVFCKGLNVCKILLLIVFSFNDVTTAP